MPRSRPDARRPAARRAGSRPSSARSRPATAFRIVDLPQPDGPRKTTISPSPGLSSDVERHVAHRLGAPPVPADVGDAEVPDLRASGPASLMRPSPATGTARRAGPDERVGQQADAADDEQARRTTTTPSGACAPAPPCSRGRAPGSPPRRGSRRSTRSRSSRGTSRRSRAAPAGSEHRRGPPATATRRACSAVCTSSSGTARIAVTTTGSR